MLKKWSTAFILLLFSFLTEARAQETINPVVADYVRTYAGYAIREMQRTGVPAAIKLAQGILETEAGRSDLVMRSNNHFGIKCKSWWTGEKVYHDDDEKGECFRKYTDAYDSWKDHSDYLRSQPRYAALFELDPEDYEGWAKGLKKAGYATNPKYPQILIRYIENYHLYEYTLIALGRKKADTSWIAVNLPADKTGSTNTVSESPVTETITPVIKNQSVSTSLPNLTKVQYPESEFRINETRVIFATSGTSLLAIAEKYNVKLGWLYDFNELDKSIEILEKDQLVYLQRKRKQSHNEFHITRENETLEEISQEEGIRLESLLAYNHLTKGMYPAPGEKLFLKSEAPAMPKLISFNEQEPEEEEEAVESVVEKSSAVAAADVVQRHTVQSKETLFSLAKKYQVSQDQIKEWNKLSSGELKVGQELLIYKSR
jgi:LysM repeat protein